MKHNQARARDTGGIPALVPSVAFLSELSPLRQGAALHAFENRPGGMSAEDAAARIGAALGLTEEIEVDDFNTALHHRGSTLRRLLDPADVQLLATLSRRWKLPQETILNLAITAFKDTTPGPAALVPDEFNL